MQRPWPKDREPINEKAPAELTPVAQVDMEAFAKNFGRLVEEGGKALAAYLKPREEGQIKSEMPEELADVVKTLGHVVEYWLRDPQRAFELQTGLAKDYLELWAAAAKRLAGLFRTNFKTYERESPPEVAAAGPAL